MCFHEIVHCSADDLARMYPTYSRSAAIHRVDAYNRHIFWLVLLRVCYLLLCMQIMD